MRPPDSTREPTNRDQADCRDRTRRTRLRVRDVGRITLTLARIVLALGCLACVVFVVAEAQWESRLEHAGGAYIITAPRAPLWSPPPKASYAEFREAFSESGGFPPKQASTVVRVLKWDSMLVEALLWLWAATGLASIFYLGDERDRVLRAAAFSFLGLTAGAFTTVGLWLVLGGWGPPMPELFGLVGVAGGITYSIATMGSPPNKPQQLPSGTPRAKNPEVEEGQSQGGRSDARR